MIETIKPDAFARLKRNNLVASIIYFLLGGFIFIGSLTILAVKNFKPDIYITYLERVRLQPLYLNNYRLEVKIMEFISDIPFMLILASVLLISALFHFAVTTKKFNPEYNNNLQKGINKLKWIDGIISSVIIALIPILVGVNDFSILILLFLGSVVFNLLAMSMEQANANKGKRIWPSYIALLLIFIASIAAIVFPVLKSIEAATGLTPELPVAMLKSMNYIILAVYFAFMFFKLIQIFLQHKKVGKWKSETFNENVYIILNLISKFAVIGLVFYSVINKLITETYIILL
jgi:hypothetical protein